MDPVDVLTYAARAACLIRSGRDPEDALTGAYRTLGLPKPSDSDDPWAVRIVRLAEAAGERRRELLEFLDTQAGPLPLNRPPQGWGGAIEPAVAAGSTEMDPQVEELLDYAEAEEQSGWEMMNGFPAFNVAQRRVDTFFGGRTVVVRDGVRLSELEAGEVRPGDTVTTEPDELPTSVRAIIDYPMDRPCLFTIELRNGLWSLWDICSAIADQYARVYEEPERWGIWGHDLSDLFIERLLYFPDKQLIYPHIGS